MMQWLNEPTHWSSNGHQIVVNTMPKTDFWRVTHYGFIRDNGHFYFEQVNSDFIAEVEIRGNYQDLYDQAGIMIRADKCHWIKAGIEYVDGMQHLSAVVTHNYSDWSVTPLPSPPLSLRLQVKRQKDAIHIAYADKDGNYIPLRLAYFLPDQAVQVGLMCASPEGNGYQVFFKNYRLIQSAKIE